MKTSIQIVVGIAMVLLAAASIYKVGYQSGQLDALNGRQTLTMITNVTTNITWKAK